MRKKHKIIEYNKKIITKYGLRYNQITNEMYNLISRFHYNLDDILKNEKECITQTQEFLVYREAENMLFL